MVAVAPNQNFPFSESETHPSVQPCGSPRLESVPNFRLLCAVDSTSSSASQSFAVFRSSRPDRIGRGDLRTFKELGIRCIIDFRSKQEYNTADGARLLDQEYLLYCVQFPRGRNYKHDEAVKAERIAPKCSSKSEGTSPQTDTQCKHYLINFFTLNYIRAVFNRAPLYIRLYSLFYLLYDYIFHTGHKYFVRLFARTTLNSTGLIGQYKDMIEYSQRSICAALKLLSNPENLPALLNCAHGKDRTGIVSALLLCCLGKSPHYIAQEYALSEEGLEPMRKRLFSEVVERFHMSEDFISAQMDTMLQLFDYINAKYGSVENYMEFIGFGARDQARLRSLFLEEARDKATANQTETSDSV